MARRRGKLLGFIILLLVFGAGALAAWFAAARWAPPRAQYPVQGVYLDSHEERATWPTMRATGVDFAYLLATTGSEARDPDFQRRLAAATAAEVRVGAVHRFDLCRLAGDQAGNFITNVPRDPDMLPPVIELRFLDSCKDRPGRAVVLSELATLIAQIENHSGKPAIVKLGKEFEALYDISSAVNRTVWLDRDFFPPDYAARPFVMWTANDNRMVSGLDGPGLWVVVRP
ncbi:GH25 family lysozyme [Novosphingopyxis sp.]|uniref:GH25 family lysozyme n=1 Tax=Novosphingopyxis sp. TaxID=2709690 RepID=UPI003B599889